MKNVFILNPIAGAKEQHMKVLSVLKAYYSKFGGKYSYNITQGSLDATEIARYYANKGEEVSIFAGGGDGTLCEVVNGIVGYDNAYLGIIPYGSGNDFVKMFESSEPFLDIKAQNEGQILPIDIMKCNDKYSINISSIGLDADVAYYMSRYRNFWKKSSYMISIIECMLRKIGVEAKITIDDQIVIKQKLLLALSANGRYYGNGFNGAPNANISDGLLDFLVVDKISRLKIASFIGKYKKGEHEKLMRLMKVHRGHKMKIESKHEFVLNRDGECEFTRKATIQIIPKAIKLIVPNGAVLRQSM